MDQAGSGSGVRCCAAQGGGGRQGGALTTDDNAARRGARPREPGLIQTNGPRPVRRRTREGAGPSVAASPAGHRPGRRLTVPP
ncbi:hypothetical protein SAM9427_10560 [Streptomyces sp. ETH9427]|nr:hypothetical protein SAM9427_10560 [Streptomyces sp. ETH9427]